MSRETLDYLNKNMLIGFTEKRGNAWRYCVSMTTQDFVNF